jgi:branched-chain amino acid transport system substrate-binding protein
MKKVSALVLAVLMIAAMFAGCKSSKADPKVLKIGMSGPLTAGAAVYGSAVKAGMEIAVEEINAAAGEDGLKIEFQGQDDEHASEKALNAYNNLKDWGMQIFAGAVTTSPCLAIAPEAVSDQIFMMTPSGSSDKIANSGDNVFQMCFTDPNQGASAAELVHKLDLGTTIGIIYDNSDDYSKGLMQGFKDQAAKYGMNIAVETSFTADENEDELNIVRIKTFYFKPMTREEAVMQMNLREHNFFAFRDEDNGGSFAVVYRRNDGGYGLIDDAE